MAARAGFEPATKRLTGVRSATELPGNSEKTVSKAKRYLCVNNVRAQIDFTTVDLERTCWDCGKVQGGFFQFVFVMKNISLIAAR